MLLKCRHKREQHNPYIVLATRGLLLQPPASPGCHLGSISPTSANQSAFEMIFIHRCDTSNHSNEEILNLEYHLVHSTATLRSTNYKMPNHQPSSQDIPFPHIFTILHISPYHLPGSPSSTFGSKHSWGT